ncbi:MAG: NHLP leader peptide family RiPP precursor [Gemmatimonadaceae bacterium]
MPDLNEDDDKLLREVLVRSASDATFRSQLIADPHAAVKNATGVALPADLKIQFVEQPKDIDALLVLPNSVEGDGELSPEELEAVAGGLAEMEAICWGTCDKTCGTSCTNTCSVTDISVPPIPE